MLFDLRGAGRRTTVKVVYLTLAVLMGGGLVLFGIGGDVSGGLVDAITNPRRSAGPTPTRRTPPPGPRSPAPATSSRAPATTSTRRPASSPRRGWRSCGSPP